MIATKDIWKKRHKPRAEPNGCERIEIFLLKNKGKSYTIEQLAKEAKISYATASRHVYDLVSTINVYRTSKGMFCINESRYS